MEIVNLKLKLPKFFLKYKCEKTEIFEKQINVNFGSLIICVLWK
jgi:hypothetical protein